MSFIKSPNIGLFSVLEYRKVLITISLCRPNIDNLGDKINGYFCKFMITGFVKFEVFSSIYSKIRQILKKRRKYSFVLIDALHCGDD